MDPDDCKHNEGVYHDKEDNTFPDIERCNLCGVVMNYSRKEYDDLEEGDFWYDDDDDDGIW